MIRCWTLKDWTRFRMYLNVMGRSGLSRAPPSIGKPSPAMPPETVAAFLAAEAARGIKPATIGRRVAAIRYAHKLASCDDLPTSSEVVKATVQGIRRTLGAAPVRKTPATADKVVAMAALADADMKGLRDRAILLLGFAGAFRRSDSTHSAALVAIDRNRWSQSVGMGGRDRLNVHQEPRAAIGPPAVLAIV
jgi:site-specific recombinase XerC